MQWVINFLLFQITRSAVTNSPFHRHQQSNPLNFTISPLLIHDTKNVAHTSLIFGSVTGKLQDIQLCKCSEVKNCQQLGRAEVAFCRKKCQTHLDYFNKNHTEISSCFVETQELEILNNCLQKGVPNFCNEKKETVFSNSSQTFVYNVDSTYSEFLNTPNVGLKRARRAYIQMRSYQNCFTSCAKKAEAQCLLSNGYVKEELQL
ncbi:hypothetical protein M3Y96_00939100 [Aphelenchoides besseyi]|nr:hypothetical protein M3Y96_00939100 [Aphelenchoides besseyi]